MSKFVFDKSTPPEIREVAGRHLHPLEWMIPAWCSRVSVQWQSEAEDDCSMQIVVHFDYRFAELFVSPLFLEVEEDIRQHSAIHEMIHLHVNPFYDWANRTIGVLLGDEEKQKVLSQEEARRYIEGVTQDLADTVFKRLRGDEDGKTKARTRGK